MSCLHMVACCWPTVLILLACYSKYLYSFWLLLLFQWQCYCCCYGVASIQWLRYYKWTELDDWLHTVNLITYTFGNLCRHKHWIVIKSHFYFSAHTHRLIFGVTRRYLSFELSYMTSWTITIDHSDLQYATMSLQRIAQIQTNAMPSSCEGMSMAALYAKNT